MTTIGEQLKVVAKLDKDAQLAGAKAAECVNVLRIAEEVLLNLMIEQGTETARDGVFTVSVVDKKRPHAENWDEFYKYIKRGGKLHLLERRISAKAFEEDLDLRKGKPIPGVSIYEYKALSKRRGSQK